MTLKIALIGYGRMGKKIAELCYPHRIVATCTSQCRSGLSDADVWIDFSRADGVLRTAQEAVERGKPLVIGTTGWEEDLAEVKKCAAEIGVIYSPNFSLGVHLFAQLVQQAMPLFDGYAVAGFEMHHAKKVDAPSGTAKMIAPGVPFSSVRLGSVVGQHTVLFDSEEDTITLTHQAKSRDAFAKGAVRAAEWIVGKRGFFTMEDFIKERICAVFSQP